MWTYAARRILETIPVLIGIILITFVLMQIIPGSAVEAQMGQRATEEAKQAMAKQLGLDRPWYSQLGSYLMLDFGESLTRRGESARSIILKRFVNTLRLTVAAMAFAATLGVLLGIISAQFRGGFLDWFITSGALLGISIPVFWFGMILILLAAGIGWRYIIFDSESGSWLYLILPGVTLGLRSVAYIARMTRSAMLEVLSMDYLRTARAKGVSPLKVISKHGLSNALIPVVTVIGLDFASYLTGAVLTETIFNYPGIGREIVESIGGRDTNVILCGVVLVTFTFVIVNLMVDLLYAVIDPRIRHSIG